MILGGHCTALGLLASSFSSPNSALNSPPSLKFPSFHYAKELSQPGLGWDD